MVDITQLTQKLNTEYQRRRAKVVSVLQNRPDVIDRIKQVYGTPAFDELDYQDQKDIYTALRYAPEFFEEPKPSYKEIAGTKYIGGGQEPADFNLQKKQSAAYETINKLGLAGILKDAGTKLNTAMETGYLPDVRDKNIWGVIGEGLKYPLNTVMQSLSAFPRAGAAGSQKFLDTIFEQTGLKDKGIDTIADIQKAKDTGTLPTVPKMSFGDFFKLGMGAIGQGTLESAKAAVQPLVNPKSQYANYGYANLLEKQGEGTKFTTPFVGTENWEQGNWLQRLLSGFAGKPSDIVGLAADVILDPLTYLSGGVGKGAASGATLTDDLIKAGVKVLPKEAPIALSKVGRSAFKSFFEETYPNIFKAIDRGLITPNAVSKTITATDDIAKQTAKNIIANKALNKFLQDSPDAVKYLDLGGTKMFGQTIIPGFKYAKAGKWFENTGLGKFVQKAFNAKSGIPQEFRNVFGWLESAGEAKTNEYIKAFNTITKGSSEADRDLAQKYLWQMADVEKQTNKLTDIGNKLAELTPEQTVSGLPNKISQVLPENVIKRDFELYGTDLPNIGRYHFGEPTSELGKDIVSKIPKKEYDQIAILAQSSVYPTVRRDARMFNYILSDRVEDSFKIDKLLALQNKLESAGTAEGNIISNAIDNIVGKTVEKVVDILPTTMLKPIEPILEPLANHARKFSNAEDFLSDMKRILLDKTAKLTKAEEAFKASMVTNVGGSNEVLNAYSKTFGDFNKTYKNFYDSAVGRITETTPNVIQEVVKAEPITKVDDKLLKSLKLKQTRATNLINKYTQLLPKLTDRQQQLVNNLKELWKTVADDYVASTGKELKLYDFYTPIRYVKDEAGQPIKRTSLLGAVEQPFSKKRTISMAQAEKQGLQPKSLIENTMQRLAEQQKNVMRSRVLNEVSQFGSNVAKEGFEKVKGIPELKNMYLPKEYHKALTNVYTQFFGDDATKNFVKILDKATTIWKRGVLATPGYHFRNFFTDNVSGLMEYGTSFYNPKYWLDAGAIMKGEHKLITLNGAKVYADDVLKEMLETGELVTQTAIEGKLGTGSKIIQKISPAELSLRLGNVRENLGRAVAGVIERDNGSSKIMAAANVKKVFFDYAHSLTPFEQNIMKRAIPFYTWLKNNLRRQVELLFTRTGKYAAIPKAMNFVENISEIPEGYKEFRPEYQQDLSVLATPFRQPGLPDWLANMLGREKTTQAGNMLGYNPNMAFQDWSRLNPKDMFSAMSPFAKIPIELAANRNIFTGAEVRTGSDKEVMPLLGKLLAKLPEGAMEKLGFYLGKDGKVYTSSTMDYLLKQLPQYAIGQRTLSDTINTPYQNISTGLGIKMIPYDETQAKEQYTTDWQKEATKALNKYKTQTGTEPPSTSQINSAYKEIYTNAINEKYAEVLQLKDLLDVVGSSKELDSYVAELLKPYNEEINKTKDMDIQQLKDLLKSLGINVEQLSLQDIEAILAARK